MRWITTGSLLLGLVGGALVPAASPASELSILSYNTHGLPAWIARDDPEMRFPKIGRRTNDYDLALLQEDFAHHRALLRGAHQAVVRRGNASQRSHCPICSGAGLTLLAGALPAVEALWNVPYQDCSGWLFGGADCLASKGFQLARVQVADAPPFYVVNTHLDAGRDPADRAVRARQLAELRQIVERQVGDAALVVAGDFNLIADVPADRQILDGFRSGLGLCDSGARAGEAGGWVVLDYILYRSGAGTGLRVLASGEDVGFAADGEPLSDHPAIFARFAVEPGAGDCGPEAEGMVRATGAVRAPAAP